MGFPLSWNIIEESIGGKYVCDEHSEAHLSKSGAEATALDGYTILFRRKPGQAAVYEELYHTKQFFRVLLLS